MQFGSNNNTGWTVVDCSDDGLSLCAVSLKTAGRGGSRPQVLAAAEISDKSARANADAAAPPAVEPDPAALRELIAKTDRSLPVLMTLARSQYQLRVVPEPPVPPREMHSSLRWSLASDSDSPGEEFNLAWLPIPTEEHLPARPKQLYAVMTPSAWLNRRLAAWRHSGVKPKVVDIRETALRNLAGALERPGEGLALVCADAGGVGMAFTFEGSLYLDRYIEQPMAELQAADPATQAQLHERIAVQLLRSIDVIARNYPFIPVTRLVVGPEMLGLLDFLKTQLPMSVEALDLNTLFDLSKVPELAQSRALQARCLVALGAALRSTKARQ